jgi:hypothetical protein
MQERTHQVFSSMIFWHNFVDDFCWLLGVNCAIPQPLRTHDNLADVPACAVACRSYNASPNQICFRGVTVDAAKMSYLA